MYSFVVCCFYVLCIVLLLCVACVVLYVACVVSLYVVCRCMLCISYFPSPSQVMAFLMNCPHAVSVSIWDKGGECLTANCVWCVSVSMPMCVRTVGTYVYTYST